jgi:hypothetical protein
VALMASTLVLPATAWPGEMVTEVLRAGFRPASELIAVIQPLVPAPGSVTGMLDRIVVRTTPENLASVKAVLAELDRPPHRLMISVKRERLENLSNYGAGVVGRVRAGDVTLDTGPAPDARRGLILEHGDGEGGGARVRIERTERRTRDAGVQQIQTLEGRPAFISAGQSIPVGERSVYRGPRGTVVRDNVTYRDASTGFYAVANVHDDQVTLRISPYSVKADPRGGGRFDVQAAETVVSGRLGEWIMVGGTSGESDRHGSGLTYATGRDSDSNRVIMLKVDSID